jgi:hypothetical protein
MKRSATVVAICVTSVMAGGAAAVARRSLVQQTREELPQPAAWVAFEAKVTVQRGGAEPLVGKFYRSSDGSTRLETGPAEGDVRVVDIKNIPTKAGYVRKVDGTWISKPIDEASADLRPQRFHAGMPFLARYPRKVSILKGQPYSLSSDTGFSAYQLMQSNGGLLLLVPELNFFPIVRERLDGRREVYTDVSLLEPDVSLFLPPPGATVEVLAPRRAASRSAP